MRDASVAAAAERAAKQARRETEVECEAKMEVRQYSYRTSTSPSDSLKVPCAPKWFDSRVSNNQNDETLSQNSLRYLSKVKLPIALT